MSTGDDKRTRPDLPLELPCEPPSRRIVDRLDEPIEAGDCCVHQGRPCILFGDWDYAEDWSGEFVRVLPPQSLADAPRLTVAQFWTLVRQVHSLPG